MFTLIFAVLLAFSLPCGQQGQDEVPTLSLDNSQPSASEAGMTVEDLEQYPERFMGRRLLVRCVITKWERRPYAKDEFRFSGRIESIAGDEVLSSAGKVRLIVSNDRVGDAIARKWYEHRRHECRIWLAINDVSKPRRPHETPGIPSPQADVLGVDWLDKDGNVIDTAP